MFRFYIYHYAILKKLYKKRFKKWNVACENLAFICIIFLSIFIWSLFIDRTAFWEYKGKSPISNRIDFVMVMLTVFVATTLGAFYTYNFSGLRQVVKNTNKITKTHAVFYLSLYFLMLISTFFLFYLTST